MVSGFEGGRKILVVNRLRLRLKVYMFKVLP